MVTLMAADADSESGFGIYELPRIVAMRLNIIADILNDTCVGQDDASVCIPLPAVEAGTLLPIIEYIQMEDGDRAAELTVPGRSSKCHHPWVLSEEYAQPRPLAFIIQACLYLGLESLCVCASREFSARYISGRSPDEIRETFGIEDDLSPEEVDRIAVDNGWRVPAYEENWKYGVDMDQ